MSQILLTAIKASLEAGKEILKIYNSDFSFEKKEDNSPLTLADKNAHKVISEHLKKTPFPIISEEGKHLPFSNRKKWDTLWIVDPLDGTKEFVKRNDEFTVNIALVKNNQATLGVIYIPVTKTLYFAYKNIGAYKIENIDSKTKFNSLEELLKLSVKLPLTNNKRDYTVAISRSHLSETTKDYLQELKLKHGEIKTIAKGSSLKFCIIAEGLADEYPRNAPTMEWDTAAGHAILNSVGFGIFYIESNNELSYNKEDLHNPYFTVRKI